MKYIEIPSCAYCPHFRQRRDDLRGVNEGLCFHEDAEPPEGDRPRVIEGVDVPHNYRDDPDSLGFAQPDWCPLEDV